MKNILLLCCLTILSIGCIPSQAAPDGEELAYVHEFPNMTKDQIYDKSLMWLVETFGDSKSVIEIKDKDAGRIMGKGLSTIMDLIIARYFKYTILIEVKEGRARVQFKNLHGHDVPGVAGAVLGMLSHLKKAKSKLEALNGSYRQYMTSKSDNNW